MKKDTISFDNIKQDLINLVKTNFDVKHYWRYFVILNCTFASIILFLMFWSIGEIYLGLIFILPMLIFPIYHIIRIIKPFLYYKSMNTYIQSINDHEHISISVEILSHISKKQINEPHQVVFPFRWHSFKEACFLTREFLVIRETLSHLKYAADF